MLAPLVGGNITDVNGYVSVYALGEDHEEKDDEERRCDGREPPRPYSEEKSAPTTAEGSG